jgi:hypothetical protein
MDDDYSISGDFGQQLPLEGSGPLVGHRYQHVRSGQIVTCLLVVQARRRTVTLRVNGEERELSGRDFDTYYELYRPPSLIGYAR